MLKYTDEQKIIYTIISIVVLMVLVLGFYFIKNKNTLKINQSEPAINFPKIDVSTIEPRIITEEDYIETGLDYPEKELKPELQKIKDQALAFLKVKGAGMYNSESIELKSVSKNFIFITLHSFSGNQSSILININSGDIKYLDSIFISSEKRIISITYKKISYYNIDSDKEVVLKGSELRSKYETYFSSGGLGGGRPEETHTNEYIKIDVFNPYTSVDGGGNFEKIRTETFYFPK